MRKDRVRHALVLVALAAVLSLAGGFLEQSFVHTDDGCAVEIHCIACRLALGSTAVTAAAPTLLSAPLSSPAIESDHLTVVDDHACASTPSRGPPTVS